MKENAGGRINEKGGNWARSIFQVIDDLVKYDVSSNNHVFAVGVGARFGEGTFDILSTTEQFQRENTPIYQRRRQTYEEVLEEIFRLLENGGAGTIRKWAQKSVIRRAVKYDLAVMLLNKLNSSRELVKTFVYDCLPSSCRDWVDPDAGGGFGFFSGLAQGAYAFAATQFVSAKEEDVMEAVAKFLQKNVGSIFMVHRASDIVHGCVDEKELNEERLQELMETIEPFIYGRTPLFKSLEEATQLFHQPKFSEHEKLLFVLSDGYPTDDGNLERVASKMRQAGITVVSCFITKSTYLPPKKLHNEESWNWEEGAKFLFRLSSTIPTQLLPRTIFIKRGWDIDISNNETKLFLQVNHPDNIHDACDLTRNVVCCQDALSDLLVSVSLDIYINQSTAGFKAQEQVGGTCYANASAAVLHLAMKRILGREGGYPDFNILRQEMINLHGEHGADTLKILKEICPRYRLQCEKVDVIGAMKAVTAKRPVVARFRLTDREWDSFSSFYIRNRKGVLTKKEIDIGKRIFFETLGGHAVVLTSFNSECLRFMNSWGVQWADMGFFRVQNAEVLDCEFIDVYWTPNDLTQGEKVYHQQHGPEVARKLLGTLTGLQKAEYQCPLCNVKSLVTEFKGTLLQAVCPKCHREFPSDKEGNILALNMYLTSLVE